MTPQFAQKCFGFSLGAILWLCSAAWSIPALDKSWTETQPDGSTIEIRKFGNEHFNYTGTKDGEPIQKDSKGQYKFINENGELSDVAASHTKHPFDKEKVKAALHKKFQRFEQKSTPDGAPSKAPATSETSSAGSSSSISKLPSINTSIISGSTRALVLLVQFQDTKFISSDPQAVFNQQLNEEGYNESNTIGSARDYFIQNSNGLFSPIFDVVGPITISGKNYSKYGQLSTRADLGAQDALSEALDSLKKSGFDFKPYDSDGDRYIDFLHMIYAGFGSHDSGLDSAIWPHKWVLASPKRLATGLYADAYACSAERDGYALLHQNDSTVIAGVGNFLHEFSHLMGLPDLYPTKEAPDAYSPKYWSIMDQGAYNTTNTGAPLATAPPYYSAFERLSLGWITPTDLDINGNVKLAKIDNNVAIRVESPLNSNEFFLMEYRSKKGWDIALPNHGMLIWHIDYKSSIWSNSDINNDGSHQYVDIEEADGIPSIETTKGDAFPGSYKVTEFDQFILWNGTDMQISLSDIAESKDRTYVTFNVSMDAPDGTLELIEGIETDTPVSSSEEEIESSSSEDQPTIVSNGFRSRNINLYTTKDHSKLTIAGLPANARVYLFSVNGQLLYHNTFTGGTAEIDTRKFPVPLLVKIK